MSPPALYRALLPATSFPGSLALRAAESLPINSSRADLLQQLSFLPRSSLDSAVCAAAAAAAAATAQSNSNDALEAGIPSSRESPRKMDRPTLCAAAQPSASKNLRGDRRARARACRQRSVKKKKKTSAPLLDPLYTEGNSPRCYYAMPTPLPWSYFSVIFMRILRRVFSLP